MRLKMQLINENNEFFQSKKATLEVAFFIFYDTDHRHLPGIQLL